MESPFKKIVWIVAGAAVVCAAVAAVLFVIVVQPGGSGVLAAERLEDGSEYMVAQTCNWGGEPYTVGFYMRRPGGRWGWCYIDHEAHRWKGVRMRYDALSDSIVVTERGMPRAVLDRRSGIFRFNNARFSSEDGAFREVEAPQSWMNPPYPFP